MISRLKTHLKLRKKSKIYLQNGIPTEEWAVEINIYSLTLLLRWSKTSMNYPTGSIF
jgi:hypothetical protein